MVPPASGQPAGTAAVRETPGATPPAAQAEGEEEPLRMRMMFEDGSVQTTFEDPEQQEQIAYILKNLLPPK